VPANIVAPRQIMLCAGGRRALAEESQTAYSVT